MLSPPPRWRDEIRLLRPRQWPILSAQLAVGVLLSPSGDHLLGGSGPVSPQLLFLAWLAWVIGLNGGTLAYNSAYDRDTSPVAYLPDPPPPPPGLAGRALLLMLAGTIVAWAVTPPLGWLTLACTGLSVLYSHPRTRAKGIPGLDLAINMTGYGGGTTLAGLLAAAAATGVAADAPPAIPPAGWWLCGGFALLFGSLYPLTQLYQVTADRRRGDRTLAVALGVRPSLALAMALAAAAVPCLLVSLHRLGGDVRPPVAALAFWLGGLAAWWWRAARFTPEAHARGLTWALRWWAVVDVTLVWGRFR